MKRKTILYLTGLLSACAAAYYISHRRSQGNSRSLPNQSIYRLYAPFYDRLFGFTYAGARQHTAQLLQMQPGEHLLISGVGTGLDLPLIGAGVRVTGVDISTDMLAQARRKSSRADVNLVQMDAQCLELPDASVDAALLNLIVSVAPDGKAVFHEAWRALKPGGRLVLFDKFAPESRNIAPLRRLLGSFFRWLGTDINRKLSDITGDLPDGIIEAAQPSLFFSMYQILKFKKLTSSTSLHVNESISLETI